MLLYNPDRESKVNKVSNPTDGGLATVSSDGSFVDTGVLFSDIPVLTEGKLNPNVLPPLGISEVYVVADIAARDALTVQSGDVAKVTDSDGSGHPQTYIYDGSTWIDIQETSDVISVNGKTQTVVLVTDDISEGSSNLYYTEARVTANSDVAANTAKLAGIEAGATADQIAAEVSYDNASSGLTATETQSAIDELSVGINSASNTISNISSSDVSYDNTASGLSAINAQQAVDEIEGRLDTAEDDITALSNLIAQPNGIASLDGSGKIPSAQLPAIAVTDVSVVADITARDALTVQTGDIAKVTDSDGNGNPSTYIYDGSAWVDFQETSDVISVNGQTQTVVLGTDDINEGSTNLYYTDARVAAHPGVAVLLAASEFWQINGSPGNSALAEAPGSVAIGENCYVDSSCVKGLALGWQTTVDANAVEGLVIGTDSLVENAFRPIAIGSGASSSADNAIQIGTGGNLTANTLKYLNVFVANENSVMTAATNTVNYVPNATNEVDSHLTAIDTKFGAVDTAVAACEVALIIGTEKTANFTATGGNLEPVNCSAAAITVNPPPAPAVGDKFAVVDSRSSSGTNSITIDFASAGQLLYGISDTFGYNEDGSYSEFKFLGGAIGWIVQK